MFSNEQIGIFKVFESDFLGASTMCNVEAGSSAEKFCCQCRLPRLVVGLPASGFEGRSFQGGRSWTSSSLYLPSYVLASRGTIARSTDVLYTNGCVHSGTGCN